LGFQNRQAIVALTDDDLRAVDLRRHADPLNGNLRAGRDADSSTGVRV
jgi:hypothetical protein